MPLTYFTVIDVVCVASVGLQPCPVQGRMNLVKVDDLEIVQIACWFHYMLLGYYGSVCNRFLQLCNSCCDITSSERMRERGKVFLSL
jgi:hypothetical protein